MLSINDKLPWIITGSDDAIPPYIPTQYLGSRKDEPVKHPTGIYGNNTKDALSTIDEKSVGVSNKSFFLQ